MDRCQKCEAAFLKRYLAEFRLNMQYPYLAYLWAVHACLEHLSVQVIVIYYSSTDLPTLGKV